MMIFGYNIKLVIILNLINRFSCSRDGIVSLLVGLLVCRSTTLVLT